jgi:hypothetical protein
MENEGGRKLLHIFYFVAYYILECFGVQIHTYTHTYTYTYMYTHTHIYT